MVPGMLAARDIHVNLGDREVLRGVSVQAKPGCVLALLGPNGSGKTTLVRALAGLVEPWRGQVLLGDADLRTVEATERARKIAYVPQNVQCHWPITGAQMVALGRLPHGGAWGAPAAADRDAVERALAALDATDLAERRVDEVSGGELRRLAVARAVATEAGTILLDEPNAGLDPAHQFDLVALCRALAHERRAVVVTVHDATLASAFATDVALMSAGKIVAAGHTRTVLTPENLQDVYRVSYVRVTVPGGEALVPVN